MSRFSKYGNEHKWNKSSNKARHVSVRTVVNISDRYLDTTEESVQSKGFNFAKTIRRVSYLDIITPVEKVTLKIPKAQTDVQ